MKQKAKETEIVLRGSNPHSGDYKKKLKKNGKEMKNEDERDDRYLDDNLYVSRDLEQTQCCKSSLLILINPNVQFSMYFLFSNNYL